MAKKQVPAEKSRKQKSPDTQNKSKIQRKNSTTVETKNKSKSRNKASNTATDDPSSEEKNEVLLTPSPSPESQNGAEEDRTGERSLTDEDDEERKTKPKIKVEKKKLKSVKRKSEKDDAKSKGEKRSKREEDEDDESDAEEKSESALYRFPMNRVSRIIKSENPDFRVSQEAVFVINRASEKFLEVFCGEAYACSFLQNKTYTAYNHLSSVVAKRKRFEFLSDFVPEKVKAEDALAQIPEDKK